MLISRTDPLRAMMDLQRALDTYRASDWLAGSTAARGAFPPINIFRHGEDCVAIIELAGIDRNHLTVEAQANTIRISGKKLASYPENASYHRRERVFGTFDRTISVPIRVDADNLKAEYKDGILAVFIPRAEEDKPRKISVA